MKSLGRSGPIKHASLRFLPQLVLFVCCARDASAIADEPAFPPDDPVRIGINVAGRLMNKARYPEARDAFAQVIKVDPDQHVAYYRRGLCWLYEKRFKEAHADLTSAIERLRIKWKTADANHDNVRLRADLAKELSKYYWVRSQIDDDLSPPVGELNDLTEAIAVFPQNAKALHNRADVFYGEGRVSEALADIDQALTCEPREYKSYKLRSLILAKLNRRVKSQVDKLLFDYLAACDKTRKENLRNGLERANEAIEHDDGLKFDSALASLDSAVLIGRNVLAPDDTELASSLEALARLRAYLNDSGNAIELLEEALQIYARAWPDMEKNTGFSLSGQDIAITCFLTRQFDRAEHHICAAAESFRLNWGSNSKEYAACSYFAASILMRQGDLVPRQRDYKRALTFSAIAANYATINLATDSNRHQLCEWITTYIFLLKKNGLEERANAELKQLATQDNSAGMDVIRKLEHYDETTPLPVVGDRHPVGKALVTIRKAELAVRVQDWTTALTLWNEGLRQLASPTNETALGLSDDQLSAFLLGDEDDYLPSALSLALIRPDDKTFLNMTAEWLLNRKAIRGQVLARRYQTLNRLVDSNSSNSDSLQELLKQLREVRAQCNRSPQDYNLRRIEARLDEKLAKSLSPYRTFTIPRWIGLNDFRKAIPSDGVVIDMYRVMDREGAHPLPLAIPLKYRDAAWVIWPVGREPGVTLVDLGDPAEFDNDFEKQLVVSCAWAPDQRKKTGRGIAKLLKEGHISDADQWWVSPYGQWWSVAWDLYKDPTSQKYVVEEKIVRYVTSGRNIVPNEIPVQQTSNEVVTFTPHPNSMPSESGAAASDWLDVLKLPDLSRAFPKSRKRNYDIDARNAPELFFSLRKPTALILNTHGIIDEDINSAPPNPCDDENSLPRPNLWRLCTLKNSAHKNSVLSALDVLSLDLSGSSLVALLACESAQMAGVPATKHSPSASLREAFHIAGASAVVGALGDINPSQSAEVGKLLFRELACQHDKGKQIDVGLALTKAKRNYLKQFSEQKDLLQPQYWSGLAVSINGSPTGAQANRLPSNQFDSTSYRQILSDGESSLSREQKGRAWQLFNTAVATAPDDFRGYWGRARASDGMLRDETVLADLDKAVELAPNKPEIHAYRAHHAFNGQLFDLATLDCDTAAKLGDNDPDLLRIKWYATWFKGDYDEARKLGVEYVNRTEKK